MLDELSFLAMECDIRQAGWIGGHVLERYGQTNGDHPADGLLSFYKCYRATVHAKVAALRAEQHPTDPSGGLELGAPVYAVADTYAAGLGPPLLVVMRGPAGCGKSSVAAALSDTFGPGKFADGRDPTRAVPAWDARLPTSPCIATTIAGRFTRNCCGGPDGGWISGTRWSWMVPSAARDG